MVKNSYSSGRNDDRLQNPNGKNEPQSFAPVEEGGSGENIKDVLQCHPYSAVGNMNLNNMLVENIRSHDYFKGLSDLKTFEEVVDQVYYDAKFATPWVPGTHRAQRASGMCSGLRGVSNAGTPSTAYMLLFKLYTLQITKGQIRRLLDHADSPYIRTLGFLYLRHVCDPKELYAHFQPYLHDAEEFSVDGSPQGATTIGKWPPSALAAKAETAAEKLARLRAKQAALAGGAYLGGRIGGDYASSSSSATTAKGLQRYQQLVRDGRKGA